MYFKKIRKKRNLTLEELAQKSGGYKSNLSLVENGKLNLKLGLAQRISKVLNCRVSDLTGETIFDDKKELSKTIQVKYFKDIFVSAGCGCFINNENYELIDIEETFFKKINENNYNNIVVVNAVGDSMSPTIKNGDLLFIDTSKKDIINNKIYIINENNYLKVKRILRKSPFEKNIIIKSDNEVSGEYPPYEVNMENINNINFICGQVVYAVHNFK